MGGRSHPKLNIWERPIAKKYCEGKVKRTLKRRSKVLETVRREPTGTSDCRLEAQPEGVWCGVFGRWRGQPSRLLRASNLILGCISPLDLSTSDRIDGEDRWGEGRLHRPLVSVIVIAPRVDTLIWTEAENAALSRATDLNPSGRLSDSSTHVVFVARFRCGDRSALFARSGC